MDRSPVADSPVASVVRAWVDLYTRGLPAEVRAARSDEIDDDLWCEQEEAAKTGRLARSLDVDLALRLAFGIPADLSWRMTFGGRTSDRAERSPSMNTRVLGVLAAVAGASWATLMILYVPMGDALWTGSIGAVVLVATLVGAIGFAATSLGLVYLLHDRVSRLSAVAAGLVALGALGAVAGSGYWIVIALAAGSAVVMWDLARIGVITRWVSILQAVTAIGYTVWLLPGQSLMPDLSQRAIVVLLIEPFVLSWLVIGLSLYRGLPEPQPARG